MQKTQKYLEQLIPKSNEFMCSLEQYASEHRVPIMEKEGIHFLTQLIRLHQPDTILELGTAIGYSALRMHEAAPTGHITTLERDEEMVAIAKENIKLAEKEHAIKVIHADAFDALEQLNNEQKQFDFIFIDAAKGQYKKFFSLVEPLLTNGGVIVCDNVLFKGLVVDPSQTDNKRLQKLAKKIDIFNHWLMQNELYHTSLIPIGDGITISMKKSANDLGIEEKDCEGE